VREHGTNRPLEAQVVITDNTNAEIFARLTCNSQTGIFSAEVPVGRQVGLTVQAQGFSQFSDRFEIPEGNTQPMAREISLWPVVEGSRTILRNIYFLLDSDSLLPTSRTELDYIAYVLQQNTELRMKVEGHCDATGPADYNLALSHKRAQSVVRYLVAKGIAAERLTALGLGETRLLSHENSEAAHAINRRVEFVVEGQPRR
jgi:outer membrane protein OmpA-like peptidoglycan-associated protein